MTIVEKAAYLKGLTEGLGIEPDSRDGKLWNALCELVSDMAHEIEDLQESSLDFAGAIDDMSEDLSYLEELTCGLDTPGSDSDDDSDVYTPSGCGRCCCTSAYDAGDADDGDYEDDEELDYDGVMYDVTCPVCGEEITFDEGTLSEGSIICPQCGEELEFELDAADDGEEAAAEENEEKDGD